MAFKSGVEDGRLAGRIFTTRHSAAAREVCAGSRVDHTGAFVLGEPRVSSMMVRKLHRFYSPWAVLTTGLPPPAP